MADLQNPGSRALRKGRYSQKGGIYLVTTVTDQRIPWFQAQDLGCIMSRCLQDSTINPSARLLCWVVMPDHVHLLVQLGDKGLSAFSRSLKSNSARQLNHEIGRTGRFWEPGYHDHGLRPEEDVRKFARYVVSNPIRAGLVTKVADYPFWNAVWI